MKKYSNDNIRKITQTGRGSYYVVIPKELMKDLGWRGKQKVAIRRIKGGLSVRDFRSK
jgi:bifunctional DNA-binding transcriptional regulator/antitoxin component of YhaV-PrlF toxin-antitoxin module